MKNAVEEFIRLLESRETWGFKYIDKDLLQRAEALADAIIIDVRQSSRVPLNVWVMFVALLPLERSLLALQDLTIVLPDVISRMAMFSSPLEDEMAARHAIIDRLNTLYRRKLHDSILTERCREAIDQAMRYVDGNY